MYQILEEKKTKSFSQNLESLSVQLNKSKTHHPALNRMKDKINKNAGNVDVITDYSRMHHRHNRS